MNSWRPLRTSAALTVSAGYSVSIIAMILFMRVSPSCSGEE
ncbi:hypothetical protein [Bacteroides faecichinchillae]